MKSNQETIFQRGPSLPNSLSHRRDNHENYVKRQTDVNPVLDLAVRYHAMGFNVVPAQPHVTSSGSVKKLPATGIRPRELHEILSRPQSEDQVRDVFRRCPEATLVGLVLTPQANRHKHRHIVLDFDSQERFDALKSELLPILNNTWIVKTRRGMHIYVRLGDSVRLPTRWKSIPCLDIKRSGYVIAPGSADPALGLEYRFIQGPPCIPEPVILSSLAPLSCLIHSDALPTANAESDTCDPTSCQGVIPLWTDLAPKRTSIHVAHGRPSGLSRKVWDLLLHNCWKEQGYRSRSEADMAIINALANQGYDLGAIEHLFAKHSPVGSKYRELTNPHAYLEHTYNSARRFLSAGVSAEIRRYAAMIGSMQWSDLRHAHTDRRVLNTLLHSARRLRSFPDISISLRELAAWSRYSLATVQRSLKRLQGLGLLIHRPSPDQRRRLAGLISLLFPEPAAFGIARNPADPRSSDCSDIHHPLWSAGSLGERGRMLYHCARRHPVGLSLKELASHLSLPRSTAYHLRKRMLALGLLIERSGILYALPIDQLTAVDHSRPLHAQKRPVVAQNGSPRTDQKMSHRDATISPLECLPVGDHFERVVPRMSSEDFFSQPILNSPYEYPGRHWALDELGQPTGKVIEDRRRSQLITPIPRPQKQKKLGKQAELDLLGSTGLDTAQQKYDPIPIINLVRGAVDEWRKLESPGQWMVTPETARLLEYWRHHPFQGVRPFFCQVEAVETLIWLTEVAPKLPKGAVSARIWDHIKNANAEANPELLRVALKLATGAGKTTVMAMIIAWQTINAVRRPTSSNYTRGFLIITPGITIRDRLRVLQPSDPDSYYRVREIVPSDMITDLERAKVVITNYHSFKLREKTELSKVGRSLLKGRGPDLNTAETEGQMIQRVMPELMGMKNVLVINDEAHHCYREKPEADDLDDLKGEEKDEAERNNEAARLWISGIETVKRKLGVRIVYDLSATPFFLRGSGYAEGTLFHWTVSDFSLMDAIEAGIVKLPRIPIADNIPGGEMPKFRNLWDHIGKRMPKAGRGKAGNLDPLSLPAELLTALEALYGHYKLTFESWQKAEIDVPPVFIVVANNTSTSKLIYDYIAGFERPEENGIRMVQNGHFDLFQNYDKDGFRLSRPNTLLIDSEQLESGDSLDESFRAAASDEIERFRREIQERTGDKKSAENITDQDLLREVMNTVGKKGRLGDSIRCVVSVSMLTEGWDTNTVTHILGVRAFGTQLLCEQVVGRGLRRQSYEANENGRFGVEYADILGIPFAFTANAVVAKPQTPRKTTAVQAIPERDGREIIFPRVDGYRVELPEDNLTAKFGPDSTLKLTPELVGPSITKQSAIIGERVDLTLHHLDDIRTATVVLRLARHLLYTKFRDPDELPKVHLFGQLKRIVEAWIAGGHLQCTGGTKPAQLLYHEVADIAAERIKSAITESMAGEKRIMAVLDPYNPAGSTRFVNFTTTKTTLWTTDPRKSHVNCVALDSDWEGEFCRVAESHKAVISYVKNQSLGLEVPYLMGSRKRKYIPDFLVQVDDGREDPLNLIVEIKGYRGEDAKEKANTMRAYWVPGVNNLGKFGRWAFAEFTDAHEIDGQFDVMIKKLRISSAELAATQIGAGK